jgi:hypothetical protein
MDGLLLVVTGREVLGPVLLVFGVETRALFDFSSAGTSNVESMQLRMDFGSSIRPPGLIAWAGASIALYETVRQAFGIKRWTGAERLGSITELVVSSLGTSITEASLT